MKIIIKNVNTIKELYQIGNIKLIKEKYIYIIKEI